MPGLRQSSGIAEPVGGSVRETFLETAVEGFVGIDVARAGSAAGFDDSDVLEFYEAGTEFFRADACPAVHGIGGEELDYVAAHEVFFREDIGEFGDVVEESVHAILHFVERAGDGEGIAVGEGSHFGGLP